MTGRPTILLTNDDGILAPGLAALAEALAPLGRVVVVAPERERSAVSHAISLHKPLRLEPVREDWYACSGTPADCVYIGLHHVLEEPPALVASGINSALNLGDDVTYSGTVAGAREAALMDVRRAVALSTDARDGDYRGAAQAAARVAGSLLERALPEGIFLNVNIPRGGDADTPWRLTRLGLRRYGRLVTRKTDPRGKDYFWIGGDSLGHRDRDGSDCNAVVDGFVSLTPVRLRPDDPQALDALRDWPELVEEPLSP